MGSPSAESPSGASCCDQMEVGSPQQFPSFLNSSQRIPLSSVTTLGSIEPPRSDWQTMGSLESSTKGPRGSEATAREMHCMVVPRTRVE